MSVGLRTAHTLLILLLPLVSTFASAQSLGTFSWQLQPYCNVLSLTVTLQGTQYQLDGRDVDCAGSTSTSAVRGLAFVLPNGTLRMGLTVVSATVATPVAIDAVINLANFNGTWRDSAGNSGTFAFSVSTGGSSRPVAVALTASSVTTTALADSSVTTAKLATGAVTVSKVDTSGVQARVSSSCTAGASIRAIAADGTVTCETDDAGTVDEGSITTAKLATAAVTVAKVDTSSVQARVSSSCAAGAAIRSVGADGTVTCQTTGTLSDALNNTALGTSALGAASTAVRSTAIGSSALAGSTNGSDNTAVGFDALRTSTGGFRNTAMGSYALRADTSGSYNTASGYEALVTNTTGSNNTAVGYQAMSANLGGDSNTALGYQALRVNTDGQFNVAVGRGALAANTSGDYNTSVGYAAMLANSTGTYNTAYGRNALQYNVSGSYNTAIGYASGPASGSTGLSNTTAIGNGATVSASDTIRLGNSAITSITGQVAFTASSDRRAKEGFRPVDGDEILRKLRTLEVTSWNYIGHDPARFRHYGPMAQDFFARFGHDEIGTIGTDVTLNSGDVSGILIAALQAADRRNDQLTAEVARLDRARTAHATLLEAQIEVQASALREQATQLAAQATALVELRALVESLLRSHGPAPPR